MFFPPVPISAPIFSGLIFMTSICGAFGLTSERGAGMQSVTTFMIFSRASLFCAIARTRVSIGMPGSLRSSWNPVIPFRLPQTLKSMSPKWSSAPMMSVRISSRPVSSVTSPQEIPTTGEVIGTPASISARVAPQTDAMDVEPFDAMISDTQRTVYGKSAGTTCETERSARFPCPISRRPGPVTFPTSPTE